MSQLSWNLNYVHQFDHHQSMATAETALSSRSYAPPLTSRSSVAQSYAAPYSARAQSVASPRPHTFRAVGTFASEPITTTSAQLPHYVSSIPTTQIPVSGVAICREVPAVHTVPAPTHRIATPRATSIMTHGPFFAGEFVNMYTPISAAPTPVGAISGPYFCNSPFLRPAAARTTTGGFQRSTISSRRKNIRARPGGYDSVIATPNLRNTHLGVLREDHDALTHLKPYTWGPADEVRRGPPATKTSEDFPLGPR